MIDNSERACLLCVSDWVRPFPVSVSRFRCSFLHIPLPD